MRGSSPRMTSPLSTALQDDARVADALVAFEQVHLLGDDLPAACARHAAVPAPAAQETRLIAPELVDEKVRARHAHVVVSGREHLHVGDQPHGARGWRLRPGKAGAQPIYTVLQAPAVVE